MLFPKFSHGHQVSTSCAHAVSLVPGATIFSSVGKYSSPGGPATGKFKLICDSLTKELFALPLFALTAEWPDSLTTIEINFEREYQSIIRPGDWLEFCILFPHLEALKVDVASEALPYQKGTIISLLKVLGREMFSFQRKRDFRPVCSRERAKPLSEVQTTCLVSDCLVCPNLKTLELETKATFNHAKGDFDSWEQLLRCVRMRHERGRPIRRLHIQDSCIKNTCVTTSDGPNIWFREQKIHLSTYFVEDFEVC